MKTAQYWLDSEFYDLSIPASVIEQIQQDAFAAGQVKGREDGMREAAELVWNLKEAGLDKYVHNMAMQSASIAIKLAIERK